MLTVCRELFLLNLFFQRLFHRRHTLDDNRFGLLIRVWSRSRRFHSCCSGRVSPAAWLGSISVHLPAKKRPNITQKQSNSSDAKRRKRARNEKPTTRNIHANFKIGVHRKRRCGHFKPVPPRNDAKKRGNRLEPIFFLPR